MPLYKRTPFLLLEPPKDLKPQEFVFRIRFTDEIFRDYEEYLKRLNLYRQRVWTCKVSGKINLTYEEALASEHRETEKVQQFPADLVAPVLHMIQFSTASLTDLVHEIQENLPKQLFEGLYLQAKKGNAVCPCKILEILNGKNTRYKVGWIDVDKKVTSSSIVKAGDLVIGKPPSKALLKAFIRESTCQSTPWVVYKNLAEKYGISTELPQELRNKFAVENGRVIDITKNKDDNMDNNNKRKETDREKAAGVDQKNKKIRAGGENNDEKPIKYPIDDLLVRAAPDDPVFTERPSPSSDFNVPMESVGYLIIIWDFCYSFRTLLHLWPFTLDDLANAVNHKDSNLTIMVEIHSAILHLLIKDKGDYSTAIQTNKRKPKITLGTWVEYLCDFLTMEDRVDLSSYVTTIKRGHYGLLDPQIKLNILHELVEEAIVTDVVRAKLDDCIAQRQALAATKREKDRKSKEQPKSEDSEKEIANGVQSDMKRNSSSVATESENDDHPSTAKDATKKMKTNDGAGTESTKIQREKVKENKKPAENREEQLEREIEKLSIRTSPLGKDRNYNRYWFFRREDRLFVESSDLERWSYYTSKDELDALIGSLNPKGERELFLKKQLEKNYNKISSALQKRSKDITRKIMLEENVLRRSTRVRAQPREGAAMAFIGYVNKWKDNLSSK